MDKGDGKESSLSHSAGDEVYEDKLLGADGSKKRKDNESAQSSSSSSSVSSSASSSTQSKWVGTTQTQTTPLNPWVSPLLNDMCKCFSFAIQNAFIFSSTKKKKR